MVNSGHSTKSIRVVLVGGIRGYKRKEARSVERGQPIHRSSQQSASTRRTKKLLAKTKWFREERESEDGKPAPGQGPRSGSERVPGQARGTGARVAQGRSSSGRGVDKPKELKTTTVLLVEYSKGELYRRGYGRPLTGGLQS